MMQGLQAGPREATKEFGKMGQGRAAGARTVGVAAQSRQNWATPYARDTNMQYAIYNSDFKHPIFFSPHEMKEEIETKHFEHTFAVLGTNRAAEPTPHQTRSRCVRFTTFVRFTTIRNAFGVSGDK